MEKEIIQTDDPNIIIERTVIDREINVGEINAQVDSLRTSSDLINAEIERLEASKASLPKFIVDIVDEKVRSLLSDLGTTNYQIELLTIDINKSNA